VEQREEGELLCGKGHVWIVRCSHRGIQVGGSERLSIYFLENVQTSSGAHPASFSKSVGVFSQGKVARA
jgi:hypothetical protein